MRCRRCNAPLRDLKRSYHKKRKWVCPRCGRARMQRKRRQPRGRTEDAR